MALTWVKWMGICIEGVGEKPIRVVSEFCSPLGVENRGPCLRLHHGASSNAGVIKGLRWRATQVVSDLADREL